VPYAGYLHIQTGSILLEWNDLEAADAPLARGIALSALLAAPNIHLFGCLTKVRLLAARREFAAALLLLNRLERRLPAFAPLTEAYRMRLRMQQGAWEPVQRWAHGRRFSPDFEEALTLAKVLLHAVRLGPGRSSLPAAGDPTPLREFLDRTLRTADAEGRTDRRIGLLILRAGLADAEKDTRAAEDFLRQALTLSRPGGYIRQYLEEGRPILRLLAGMETRADGLSEYIRRILEAEGREHGGKASATDGLPEPLSAREMEVLRLVAAGRTNAEIAGRLVITLNTTKKHLTHIFGKLGVSNRTEAVAQARSLDLLS
jgi:LuxR family maltose regulon positive regulatory protein